MSSGVENLNQFSSAPRGIEKEGASRGTGVEIFGRKDAVTREDMRPVADRIALLLKEGREQKNADSVFEAARLASSLSRAGFKISDKYKERFLEGENLVKESGDALRQAQYLGCLSILGTQVQGDRQKEVLKGLDESISSFLQKKEGEGGNVDPARLAKLCMWRKALDSDGWEVPEEAKSILQEDAREKVEGVEENVPQAAYTIGRAKYLGVDDAIGEKGKERTVAAIDSKASRFIDYGDCKYEQWAQLRVMSDYISGKRKPILDSVKREAVNFSGKALKSKPNFVANLRTLSQEKSLDESDTPSSLDPMNSGSEKQSQNVLDADEKNKASGSDTVVNSGDTFTKSGEQREAEEQKKSKDEAEDSEKNVMESNVVQEIESNWPPDSEEQVDGWIKKLMDERESLVDRGHREEKLLAQLHRDLTASRAIFELFTDTDLIGKKGEQLRDELTRKRSALIGGRDLFNLDDTSKSKVDTLDYQLRCVDMNGVEGELFSNYLKEAGKGEDSRRSLTDKLQEDIKLGNGKMEEGVKSYKEMMSQVEAIDSLLVKIDASRDEWQEDWIYETDIKRNEQVVRIESELGSEREKRSKESDYIDRLRDDPTQADIEYADKLRLVVRDYVENQMSGDPDILDAVDAMWRGFDYKQGEDNPFTFQKWRARKNHDAMAIAMKKTLEHGALDGEQKAVLELLIKEQELEAVKQKRDEAEKKAGAVKGVFYHPTRRFGRWLDKNEEKYNLVLYPVTRVRRWWKNRS